jgi:hypothetical protein
VSCGPRIDSLGSLWIHNFIDIIHSLPQGGWLNSFLLGNPDVFPYFYISWWIGIFSIDRFEPVIEDQSARKLGLHRTNTQNKMQIISAL